MPLGAAAQEPGPIPFRMAGIDLTLDLDYERQWLDGGASLTVENWTDTPATELPILVGRLMRVEAVAGPDGRPLPFDQDVTVRRVPPPWRTMEPGI